MTENNFNFTNGVSYDVWYEQKRLIDQLKDENGRYRKALEKIEEYQKRNCETCPLAETKKCDIRCQVFVILDIIADLRTDETKCNPDSEQIEHTAAKTQMRNSGSVEQIQDSKVKRGGEQCRINIIR